MSIVAAVVALGRTAQADCARPFSGDGELLNFHLRMTRAQWNSVRTGNTGTSQCPEYPEVEAEFRCGETDPWIKVGVHRKRGDQRGRNTDQKPPLKLDFNKVVMGQSWPAGMGDRGYRKLSLNQGQHDEPGGILPDLLTEALALRLMKREVPAAPAQSYARVYVHFVGEERPPEYHGVYILIEDLDRSAIRRRYGVAQGTLTKYTGSCGATVPEFDDGTPNAARTAFDRWNALDPNATYPNGWRGEADKAFDLEEVLRQEAIRTILGNHNDTLFGAHFSGSSGNNYLIYDPKVGRRHYFPWDLDDCFKTYVNPPSGNIPSDTSIIPSASKLGAKTRSHPGIQPRYLEITCQLIQGTLAPDKVVAEMKAMDALLRPIIPDEKQLVWAGRDPLDTSIPWSYGWEYSRQQTWYPARVESVRRQLMQRGVTCPDRCADGKTESCQHLTCAGTRRCEGGRWSPCVPTPGACDQAMLMTADGGTTIPAPGDAGSTAPSRDAGADMRAGGGGGMAAGGTGGGMAAGGAPGGGGQAGKAGQAGQAGKAGKGGSDGMAMGGGSTGGGDGDGPDGGRGSGGCAVGAARGTEGGGMAFLAALVALARRRRRHRG